MAFPKSRILSTKHLIRLIQESSRNGERFCFILGSGASVESGIPTGSQLEMRWMNCLMGCARDRDTEAMTREDSIELGRELYDEHLLVHAPEEIVTVWEKAVANGTSLPSEYYFDIYKWRFYPNRRNGYRYLERIMESCEPSIGYHTLALMLADGHNNNLVISTNFDNLVEDALFLFTDKKPLVISHESLACYIESDIQRPVVAKIHRGLMYAPFNSPETTNDLKDEWRDTLDYAFNTYTPIVIGYGGGDHSLMAFLESPDTKLSHGMFWCYLDKEGWPDENVQKMLLKQEGYLVQIKGFDALMLEIGESLYKDAILPSGAEELLTKRCNSRIRKYNDQWNRLKKNSSTESIVGTLNKAEQDAANAREKAQNLTEWDYLRRGVEAYENKQYSDAILFYNAAINLDNRFAWAYFNRGNAFCAMGKLQEALLDYNKAIELDPPYANAYYNRGNTFDSMGMYQEALKDYEKSIALAPDDAVAYFNRGVVYQRMGQYQAALFDYDRAIELDHQYANAYYNRGMIYKIAEQYDKALDNYNIAIALDAQYASAYINRGIIYTAMGMYMDALVDFEKAIRLDPDNAMIYFNRGCAFNAMGRHEEALTAYNRALTLDSNDAVAYSSRGDTFNALGKYQAALADYDTAVILDPYCVYAYLGRGNTYINLDKYQDAVEACTKAIELDPKLKEAYQTRAKAYHAMGEEEKAKADEQKAAELD